MQDNNIITNLINFGLLDNAKELQGIKLLQCNYNIEDENINNHLKIVDIACGGYQTVIL